MSKKGRANRASGAPKSSPSVRALSSVAGKPPASSKKARAAEPSEPPSSKSAGENDPASSTVTPAIEGSSEATTEKLDGVTDAKTEDLATKATTETAKGKAEEEGHEKGLEKAKDDSDSAEADSTEGVRNGKSEAPGAPAKELDDEAFFTEGARRSSMPPPIEGDAEDDRTVRLREDPEVLARRARSVKLVGYVVGGFALLLGVGVLAKVFETPHAKPPAPVFVHGAASGDEPVALPLPSAVPPSSVSSASSASSASVDASVASVDAGSATSDAASSVALEAGVANANANAMDASAASSSEAGVESLVEAGLDAKALKRACQRALDTGKLGEAIQNGEASVAADPTDGEAWLLLGASYDQKGRAAEARTAYQSCVQKGKRGPVGECAALLR